MLDVDERVGLVAAGRDELALGLELLLEALEQDDGVDLAEPRDLAGLGVLRVDERDERGLEQLALRKRGGEALLGGEEVAEDAGDLALGASAGGLARGVGLGDAAAVAVEDGQRDADPEHGLGVAVLLAEAGRELHIGPLRADLACEAALGDLVLGAGDRERGAAGEGAHDERVVPLRRGPARRAERAEVGGEAAIAARRKADDRLDGVGGADELGVEGVQGDAQLGVLDADEPRLDAGDLPRRLHALDHGHDLGDALEELAGGGRLGGERGVPRPRAAELCDHRPLVAGDAGELGVVLGAGLGLLELEPSGERQREGERGERLDVVGGAVDDAREVDAERRIAPEAGVVGGGAGDARLEPRGAQLAVEHERDRLGLGERDAVGRIERPRGGRVGRERGVELGERGTVDGAREEITARGVDGDGLGLVAAAGAEQHGGGGGGGDGRGEPRLGRVHGALARVSGRVGRIVAMQDGRAWCAGPSA